MLDMNTAGSLHTNTCNQGLNHVIPMAANNFPIPMETTESAITGVNFGMPNNSISHSKAPSTNDTCPVLIPSSRIKLSPESRLKNMMDSSGMPTSLVSSITAAATSQASLCNDSSDPSNANNCIDATEQPIAISDVCTLNGGTPLFVPNESLSSSAPSPVTPTTNTFSQSPIEPSVDKESFLNRRKRKELSLRDKVCLLKEAENNGKSQRQLAKVFGIGKTQVGLVLKRKMEILTAYKFTNESKDRKRTRFHCNEEIDTGTWEWYQKTRAENKQVTGTMLREKCLEIAGRIGKTNFKASNGWLDGFKSRHNISFSTQPVDDHMKKWLSLMPELTMGYQSKDIFVMHEFRFYFRALPQKGIHTTSLGQGFSQGVPDKDQLTVLLCANQEGELLQPIVIGHEEKPQALQDIDLNDFPVVWQYNINRALMNGAMYRKWLEDFNNTMRDQDRHIIMVLDDSNAHPKDLINLSHVKVAHLPARYVTDWNPLYHGVIQAFKVAYRRRFIEYVLVKLQNGAAPKDAADSVGIVEACQWIGGAATDITPTTILKAFLKMGLGLETRDWPDPDNSQDAQTLMYLLHTARDWMFLSEQITDPEEYAAIDENTLSRDETSVPALPSPGMGRPKRNAAETTTTAPPPAKINNFQEAIESIGKLKEFCMFNSLADVWGLLSCAEQVLQVKSSTPTPASLMPAP